MSQYKDGSVAVTNGSATVTGTSTLFVANVAVGDSFKLQGENAVYSITAVGSNTSITISPVYAGITGTGKAYVISKDFTPNHNMYEPNGGDVDWPFLLTTALRKVDSYLPLYVASQTPGANQIPVLDSSGNFLIGGSGIFHRLVKYSENQFATEIRNSSNTGPYGLYITTAASSGTGNAFLWCADTGGNKFVIAGNGNVTNINNSYGAISDIKFKENIVTASSKWDKFKQYRFVKYNLIAEPDKTLLGVIAQEVEAISPSLVEETPDMIEVDGKMQSTGETTKSVKYSIINLEADIVLQEAQARIETLEAELTALKERLLDAGF